MSRPLLAVTVAAIYLSLSVASVAHQRDGPHERKPEMSDSKNSGIPPRITPAMQAPKPSATPAIPPPTNSPPTATSQPPNPPPTAQGPPPEATVSPQPDSGEAKKTPPPVTLAKTRLVTVMLQDLPNPAEDLDEFGNRDPEKYKRKYLEELMESIRTHGMIVPPVVYRTQDGTWKIISGHRRIAAEYLLAIINSPGFTLDMAVTCLEILDASRLQLVIQSIIANELSMKLDNKERLDVVRKALDAGASNKEIAASLGLSEKAIERDIDIVSNDRVFRHVRADHLPPTTAAALVRVATKQKRLDEFLNYFDSWANETQAAIDTEDARLKREKGKGLPPAKALVMSQLKPALIKGWMDALLKSKPFTDEKPLGFVSEFDKATCVGEVRFRVNAMTDDPEHVARVAGQVSKVVKNLLAIAQTRHALAAAEGPQAALLRSDSVLDVELLNEFDLGDLALQLQQELSGAPATNPFAPLTDEPAAGNE